MKPINAYDFQLHEDFENMLSELPTKLEFLLLDEVRDKIITPLVYNASGVVFRQIYLDGRF